MTRKINDAMPSGHEVRAGCEFRSETRADGHVRVEGHAAVFNTETEIGGFFREMIMPGAFSELLSDPVSLLIEHDGLALASTDSGTLTLQEDDTGLRIASDLDGSDPDVQRIVPKMKRGDLRRMSFGFSMRGGAEEWDESDSEKLPLRKIVRVGKLYEVSMVTFPAFPTTDIGLRSLQLARAPVINMAPVVRRQMSMRLAMHERGLK